MNWLLFSGAVWVLDRCTKFLASSYLHLNEPVPVVPGLNLTLLHNTGVAFSLLSQAGGWQRWVISGLAIAVSVLIVFWIRSIAGKQILLPGGLALIMAGALGNLWDRLLYGYVVDFIQVYYGQWSFAVFNVADSAITVGAGIVILDAVLGARAAKATATGTDSGR